MSIDIGGIVERARLAAARGTGAPDAGANARLELQRVAQEFEAMLLKQMLRDMRSAGAWAGEDEGETYGAETLYETLDVELASHLARVQGLGLSKELLAAFDRMNVGDRGDGGSGTGDREDRGSGIGDRGDRRSGIQVTSANAVASGSAVVATRAAIATRAVEPTSAVAPASAVAPTSAVGPAREVPTPEPLSPIPGVVTSDFGWRRDPFTGQAKFHKGVDLRAAYGQEVQAAGGGRIVFSGEQGGYGTTVLIEHADGTRTRYAHLSAALVRAGETVSPGQPVGRAGRSGRATGTHLHFEVIGADGRPMNPRLAGHLGGIHGD